MLYLDTSVWVPLFIAEPESAAIRAWFDQVKRQALVISDWTLTEFASAMGIKVRNKQLKAEQARKAVSLMNDLATESLQIITPQRSDHARAIALLGQHALGLRAGDALHVAIAQNRDTECFYTLDRRLLDAAQQLKIKAASPIE
jgi:predicted nucleic acid-binding protein